MTLVEIIIALAIFAIISTAIVAVLYSSQNTTEVNSRVRIGYESAVGEMDVMLEPGSEATTTTPVDSNYSTEDVTAKVTFPSGSEMSIPSKKVVNNNYSAGYVKAK